eukprot:2050027-Prymnesium_polylepis.2
MMRPAEDAFDEEELQELQKPPPPAAPAQQPAQQLAAAESSPLVPFVLTELRRLALESPQNCAAVVVLLLASLAVICVMIVRDLKHDWKDCDENTLMAKHFYCFNISNAPGVHGDNAPRRLSQLDPFDR